MKAVFTVAIVVFILSGNVVFASDELIKLVKQKQKEVLQREAEIKIKQQRLELLKKDIEKRIQQYSRILKELKDVLQRLEAEKSERIQHVVKTYESMPPEDAALRLSALDQKTAVMIIRRMKPKKAASVLASMPPEKVVRITESLTRIEREKIFPTR